LLLTYLIFTGTSAQAGLNFRSSSFLIHHFKNKKKMLNLYVREGTAIQAFHVFDLALPALGISNPKGLNSRTFSYTERRKLGLIIF
jgi:hypothetical protein